MSSSAFTCITCHVAFSNGDIQREHYKTDWHRYNLKRKVAELPHVTAERFRERVLAQQATSSTAGSGAGIDSSALHCQACKKPFRSPAQYQNHLQSRKHQEQQRHWEADTEAREERQRVAEMNRKNQLVSAAAEQTGAAASDEDNDNMSVEEVDSDEWSEWADGDGIPASVCLFCPHASDTVAHNLRHMTEAHSFFMPDAEYVTDMEALLNYLGQKVGVGFVCLWCNERGRTFTSVEACQKHMRDKGHAKMLHEGEALTEYADFYDYSSSYPEGEDETSEPAALEAGGYELVLPSGAVVGHRALARYYRQSLRPEKAVALRKTGGNITARDVVKQYRLMGWVGSDKKQLQRTARDMQVLRRHQTRDHMRLGVKANRLRHRLREQNPM